MKDLLSFILEKIVNNPNDISISEETEEEGSIIRFHITVHPDDAGLVIGKEGKVINSIRSLVRVQAMKENKRVYLDLTNEKESSEE